MKWLCWLFGHGWLSTCLHPGCEPKAPAEQYGFCPWICYWCGVWRTWDGDSGSRPTTWSGDYPGKP